MPIDVRGLQEAIAGQQERSPFSGVIFVRERDRVVLAEAFGFANRAEQLRNSVSTRFGMASGAKTFTAVAVCQLAERGRVALDTPLQDCLKTPLPHFDPGVTVHHLLTHSAGIPDYFDEAVMDDYEALWRERPMYTLRAPRDFLPLFAHAPMQFKPGSQWAYNNAGYIVLGLLVEELTGMPFARYVREHILQPCRMNETGYFPMDRLPGGTAHGYIPADGGEWRTNIYSVPIVGGPDGGAYTTVWDLARFWDALMGFRILTEAPVEKMLTPYWRTNPESEKSHYGYGLWIAREEGATLAYSMVGEDPGVAFFSAFDPGRRIQFSVLGNTVAATWPMLRCMTPILRAE